MFVDFFQKTSPKLYQVQAHTIKLGLQIYDQGKKKSVQSDAQYQIETLKPSIKKTQIKQSSRIPVLEKFGRQCRLAQMEREL